MAHIGARLLSANLQTDHAEAIGSPLTIALHIRLGRRAHFAASGSSSARILPVQLGRDHCSLVARATFPTRLRQWHVSTLLRFNTFASLLPFIRSVAEPQPSVICCVRQVLLCLVKGCGVLVWIRGRLRRFRL